MTEASLTLQPGDGTRSLILDDSSEGFCSTTQVEFRGSLITRPSTYMPKLNA